jgi:hypothetical protein
MLLSVIFGPLLALPFLWWAFSFWTALQLIVGFWSICFAGLLTAEQIRQQNYVWAVLLIGCCAIPNALMWWFSSLFNDFQANWKTGLMVAGISLLVAVVVGYLLDRKDYKENTEKNTWAESELKRALRPQEDRDDDTTEQLSPSATESTDEQDDDTWSLDFTSGGCLLFLAIPLSIWIGFQWGVAIGIGAFVTLLFFLSALMVGFEMIFLGMAVSVNLFIYLIAQYGFIQGLLIGLGILAVLLVVSIIVFVVYSIWR